MVELSLVGLDVLDVPDMLVDMRVWPNGIRSVFVRVEPDEITGRRLWISEIEGGS